MNNRTIRRKVIIREYDYDKVRKEALSPLITMGLTETLYDRASFMPLNQDTLEKLKLQEILRGKTGPLSEASVSLKAPASLLNHLRDYLYNKNYINWKVTVDQEGYICVQARKNTPLSRIGWAVFEKDVTSRL